MCVIIVKGAGVELPNDRVFEHLWNVNRDGGGFCVARDNKVIGQKGFTDAPTFVKVIRATVSLEETAIIHMRIGTHGSRNPSATHPFPASHETNDLYAIDWSSSYGIAHNGTITGYGSKAQNGLSDTQEFVQKVLSDHVLLYALFAGSHYGVRHLIEEALMGDRLAIMRKDGKVALVGKFHERDGLYFSNEGYKAAYFSHGNKNKMDRKVNAYIAQKGKTEKLALAPGRAKDTSAVLCDKEDDIWYPAKDNTCIVANVHDQSPYGLCICPSCGESVYKSQVYTINGAEVCPNCVDDKLCKDKNKKTTVNYVVRSSKGKSAAGQFILYDDSQYPLYQRLVAKAKEHYGKNADWSLEGHIEGRGLIEIFSSGQYLQDSCTDVKRTYGKGKGATTADRLYDDEFFVCPEMNVLVNYDDYCCANCVHFLNTEGEDAVMGVCGSVSPMPPDPVVGTLKVAIGLRIQDICPHNVRKEDVVDKKIAEMINDEIVSEFGCGT